MTTGGAYYYVDRNDKTRCAPWMVSHSINTDQIL